jgi:hypothetical protein
VKSAEGDDETGAGPDDDEDGDDVLASEEPATPSAPCDCACHVSDASAEEPYACTCKCPVVRGYPGPVGAPGPQGRRGPTGHQGKQFKIHGNNLHQYQYHGKRMSSRGKERKK